MKTIALERQKESTVRTRKKSLVQRLRKVYNRDKYLYMLFLIPFVYFVVLLQNRKRGSGEPLGRLEVL